MMDNQEILLTKKHDLKKLKRKKNILSILLNIVEIAAYLDLQEDLEWANYEISGYPDPDDNTETQKTIKYPLYRRIIYHPSLDNQRSIDYFLSTSKKGLWFSFPIKVIVESRNKKKIVTKFNFQVNQFKLTIFNFQLTKIIDGVKSRIREFYAKITVEGILSEELLPDNQKFINIDFKDFKLSEFNEFINLINDAAYNDKYYRILPILLRTLFENLLYYIFQSGFNKKHTKYFYLEGQNRARNFSQLIALLNILKDKDLNLYNKDAINQNSIDILNEIKKFGNWTVHQIFNYSDKDFADKWKPKINRVLSPLLVLFKKLQGECLEIENQTTLDTIEKTLNLEN